MSVTLASRFRASTWLQLSLVALVSVMVFSYLEAQPSFADPDSFYHVRLTTMLRDHGLVREFPWTQSSLYRDLFIDHHLGYHLLLLPFVSAFASEFTGAKVATVLFATLTMLAAAWAMHRWRVPWWGVGVLFLLTTGPLLFRLSLVKAPSLGVGVAIFGYYLITERKVAWLFWWAWFFAWLYSAWPLLPVMALVYVGVEALGELPNGVRAAWHTLTSRRNVVLVGAIAAGCVAGLITNPYFPLNILYLKQLFTMALVAYRTFIGVGAEWYPYNPFELTAVISYPLLTWVLATVAAAFTVRRQSTASRTTWVLAVIFLAYTLRARRQVEYLVPWLILSSGLCLRDAWSTWSREAVVERWHTFKSWLPAPARSRFVLGFLVLYFILLVPLGLVRGVWGAKREAVVEGNSYTYLRGAAQWLKGNAPPRAVVFQSDWGSFPELFYYNTEQYYLTGLDQTFMYEYNHDKFWQWVDAKAGTRHDVYDVAHGTFGASYLILEKRFRGLMVWVNRDARFHRVYEDSEAMVYALTP